MLAYLKDRLVSMGPTQAQNFHDIIHAYEDLADKFGLWDAAGIMKEYGCSDDGFIDFRAWLIAQGREVYFAALADPDSLADVVPYGDCRFEQLSYVGDYAYEQLTGKSAYDQTDWSAYEALLMKLEQDIVYKDGIEFPRECGSEEISAPALREASGVGRSNALESAAEGDPGSDPCRKGL